ncbi:DGQHR domain-containing protein [Methylocystis bryophila]|uniref:DGQHR domain-containing protein n=1 Tax=Methylocystis bryophila TaxID=655015 RepID=UPI000A2728F1|nr:DGQHR domain-containing protein [Methylocystis bryophila]
MDSSLDSPPTQVATAFSAEEAARVAGASPNAPIVGPDAEGEEEALPENAGKSITEAAHIVTQGRHRFYSLTLSSDVLAACCTADTRAENPLDGFQRLLDRRRAKEIAKYIDSGFGTTPCAVILSAQPQAQLRYDRESGLLRFRRDPGAFLIIDGQHRIFGFHMAKRKIKVPVVVYNKLTRAQECQLFMDINTKQRPVPQELLLDIRRLSESETAAEALLHDVFDLFAKNEDSALNGLLSPAERRKGMISRVTFNAALKPIESIFNDASAEDVYGALNRYLSVCAEGLRLQGAQENMVNPALFKALLLLFPDIAERVAERGGGELRVEAFQQILLPMFRRLKKSELPKPGAGHLAMREHFRKTLTAGFSLKDWLFN